MSGHGGRDPSVHLRALSLRQAGLEQRLASAQSKAAQLERLLPARALSEDQQEALRLLCRAQELELENAGLQAGLLRRDSLLCQKDLVIRRCHQHRLLCESIIQDQRQLLQGESLCQGSETCDWLCPLLRAV